MDSVDRVFIDAKIGSDIHGHFTRVTTGADGANIGISEFGHVMILALHFGTWPREDSLPTSREHISSIVLVGASSQVHGIATEWSVTGMENEHSDRNFTPRQNEGQPMGAPRLVFELGLPVSIGGNLTGPHPALIWTSLGNLAPETFGAVSFTFESCHKLKIARRASARAISSADAENRKSLCVSSQTNSNKIATAGGLAR